MKSVPFAVALLAITLVSSAHADTQLNQLNNQVYLGASIEPTTLSSVQTLQPGDATYMDVNHNVESKTSSGRNAHVGVRWQHASTGLLLEGQARRSSASLSATATISGAKNAPAPTSFREDWSRKETLGNIGWAFEADGGGMLVTPFVTFGRLTQSARVDAGLQGSAEQLLKSSFFGLGLRHQTSLTPTLALELEAAYERHRLSWDQLSKDAFGQDTGYTTAIAVNRAEGVRLGIGVSQQLWKNVRANYGVRHSRLSVSAEAFDTPLSAEHAVTSLSLGLGVSF